MNPTQVENGNGNTSIKVVVDSNILVGLLNPSDHWHNHSIIFHDALQVTALQLLYFDCVVAEAVSVTMRRLFEKERTDDVEQFFNQLNAQIPKEDITWILPEVKDLYADVLALMRSTSGELNFHDALIAIVCREQQIPFIASYDRDFDQIPWLKRIATPADLTAYTA